MKMICNHCYGKKHFTVYKGGDYVSPDFVGDVGYYISQPGIKLVKCKKCNGIGEIEDTTLTPDNSLNGLGEDTMKKFIKYYTS